ncbi:MAG: recombinase family protein [bacterium]|nr:recombinase family protein [bacterium]
MKDTMKKLRAVIYCRCSTEEESQVDALSRQVEEGRTCVAGHGWQLVDEYVELKSGTTRKGRVEYNRLFENLQTDDFDIIVIKSQDRLMRNVKDWYMFLDRMVKHNKRLYMYIENKFYSPDDALITGIKAILAEDYSRELSKKINNAHRTRQRNGGKPMLTSKVFGFRKNPDGTVAVVEEEAEMIRKIYEYYLAGYGCRTIVNIFMNQGYVNKNGNRLTTTTVRRIIRNPLYKGTMVMNRQHFDFETKKNYKLPPEEWIYGEGMVPAIVDAELWKRANQAMNERAKHMHQDVGYVKGSNTGKYDLSGKLICGICRKPYYRTWRYGYSNREKMIVEWKCSNYLTNGREKHNKRDKIRKVSKEFIGGCDNIHLNEEILFHVLEHVNQEYYASANWDKEGIINQTIQILQKVLGETSSAQDRQNINEQKQKLIQKKDQLLEKFLEGVIQDNDYRRKNDELEYSLAQLQVQLEQVEQKEQETLRLEQRLTRIKERLEHGGFEQATVKQMLQDIQAIKVYDWQIEICFDPLKMMLPGSKIEEELADKLLDGIFSIRIDYPFPSETERGRYLDRRKIAALLKENPTMTANQVAAELGISKYIARNRIQELRKAGYIQFHGKGGHGKWEVLKELPDKTTSIKEGGL